MFAWHTLVRFANTWAKKLYSSAAMAQASPGTRAPADGKQSLQSLERGIAVIQVFSREHPALTLSEVARLAGITRATARRILLTLEKLGHVRSDGRLFSLTPRVLTLGWAYLSSLNLWEIAQPLMEDLARETKESCSAATLDLPDIVYVARVPTGRIMTITLGVGSRLPAHATSMGRVLLADLPPDELDRFLDETPLERYTERTITAEERLRAELATVREQGWALVDGELETGLRSIAAPIRGADGRTIAALNTSASSSRVSLEEFRSRFLPALVETAAAISANLLARMPSHVSVDGAHTEEPPTRTRQAAGSRAAGRPGRVE
jgi:IclR family pca regulon transcriptional regulator